MRYRIAIPLVLLVSGLVIFSLNGCASSHPNRDAAGERFPSVAGESLEGKPFRLPEDLAGKAAILLVGYAQDAQFDADRWILGLIQAGVKTRMVEVPTIDGFVPRLLGGTIDEGMRKGIPSEDWGSVVTVYGDAEEIVSFTGNENPNNMRVLLLDGEGRVLWHHDRGYSASKVLELKAAIPSGL